MSGPATLIAGTSTGLSTLGWRTEILTADLGIPDAVKSEFVGDVHIRRVAAAGPILSSYVSPELLRLVQRSAADIVHVHGFRNVTADLAMVLARRRTLVFQPHGMLSGYRHMMGTVRSIPFRAHDAVVGGRLVRLPHAVIASTRLERDECVAWGIPPDRVAIIQEGVDADYYSIVQRREPTPTTRLLYVGRLTRDRNLETLIMALAKVRRAGIDARLRIVGRATQSSVLNAPTTTGSLDRLAQALGVAGSVDFVGELTGRSLVKEFEAATVFVYAAQYDSFGQALAQAAAAGLAIVTTPVGVATEIVRDGETGWLTTPDVKSFGDTLIHALRDQQALKEVGQAARAMARRFQWPLVVEAYAEFYQELLRAKNRDRPNQSQSTHGNG